jgi:hypothetical protein
MHRDWQANVVAACVVGHAYTANFTLEQSIWSGVSLRMVTVSIVAAGLYFLSRKATISARFDRRSLAPMRWYPQGKREEDFVLYRRRCGAMTLRNSLEVMILVFFQNFGKWRWLSVTR